MRRLRSNAASGAPARHELNRVLSRLGLASRTVAADWIRGGRVSVNGRVVRDPTCKVDDRAVLLLDGARLQAAAPRAIMLNKPRGLVTSTQDEQGRDVVYQALEGADLPWLAPVGRLDKASEGLLLFSNLPAWAARITDPQTGPPKTYHVQVNRLVDGALLQAMRAETRVDGELLGAASVEVVRSGQKNAWLEVVLHEGRNRQIRRLLAAFDVGVLRLIRVAVGPLKLGDLPKGAWRDLTPAERDALA